MKNLALTFMSLFTFFLIAGTVILLLNNAVIGGVIISTSALGAIASLLLYDNERLFAPGNYGKYKWHDDLIILSTVILTACAFIYLFLC